MRSVITLLLFMLFIQCTEEEVKRQSITTLVGTWYFESSKVHGEFTIVSLSEEFYVDSGTFVVENTDYKVLNSSVIKLKDKIVLDGGRDTILWLNNPTTNEDMSEITITSLEYNLPTTPTISINELVKLKRKQ